MEEGEGSAGGEGKEKELLWLGRKGEEEHSEVEERGGVERRGRGQDLLGTKGKVGDLRSLGAVTVTTGHNRQTTKHRTVRGGGDQTGQTAG